MAWRYFDLSNPPKRSQTVLKRRKTPSDLGVCVVVPAGIEPATFRV